MAYSILFKLWAMIPKRLLVILVVLFFAYFKGVSDGRAPYKLAAKTQKAKAEIIVQQTKVSKSTVKQKGKVANDIFKDYECALSLDDAVRLSNIKP